MSFDDTSGNIEKTDSTTILANATETSFRVGFTLATVAQGRTESGVTYYWLAIGGLTK